MLYELGGPSGVQHDININRLYSGSIAALLSCTQLGPRPLRALLALLALLAVLDILPTGVSGRTARLILEAAQRSYQACSKAVVKQ